MEKPRPHCALGAMGCEQYDVCDYSKRTVQIQAKSEPAYRRASNLLAVGCRSNSIEAKWMANTAMDANAYQRSEEVASVHEIMFER